MLAAAARARQTLAAQEPMTVAQDSVLPVDPSAPDPRAHIDLALATVYGPAPSRRYGVSLGLNLLPAEHKRCSLRCTYCQLGAEGRHDAPLPTIARFDAELRVRLQQIRDAGGHLDALVLSGNGETTLHPDLAAAVDVLLRLRDELAPGVRTVLLTAGTELHRPEVRAAVARLDEVAVKLDAGTTKMYARLNMPWQPTEPGTLAEAAALLPNAVVQTLLVQGSVDNTAPAEIDAWLALVERARPRRVDLYTLARPPLERRLRPVSAATLERVAARVRALGLPCRTFAEGLTD